jgi:hypothetical protein
LRVYEFARVDFEHGFASKGSRIWTHRASGYGEKVVYARSARISNSQRYSSRQNIHHIVRIQGLTFYPIQYTLRDQSGCGSRIILESRRNLLLGLVIPRQTVNPRLDQDQPELGILVLTVGFEVFAYCDGFFDEVPEIFWDRRRESYAKLINVEQLRTRQSRQTA